MFRFLGRLGFAFLVGLSACTSPRAQAADVVGGPVAAQVERVIDGDTFEARAIVWPGTFVIKAIRTRGINAPEIASAHCPEERAQGEKARAFLEHLVGGKTVLLYQIADDKFGGRVDAKVMTEDGRDVAALLVDQGLAQPYQGGHRATMCALTN